jgi:LysR family transcriptional regulator for bpeEF and oprC
VELNSFTKAAASLNIPKTMLSAQVHALEQRLRAKLLHRTAPPITNARCGCSPNWKKPKHR